MSQIELEKRISACMMHEEITGKIKQVCHWDAIKHSYQSVKECQGHRAADEDFGRLPRLPLKRNSIYRATPEAGGYSHHAAICRFRDTYLAVWSNGIRDEDAPGQQILWSRSDDCVSWSPYLTLAANRKENSWWLQLGGLYAAEEQAVAYCNRFEEGSQRIDAFTTKNGSDWEEHSSWLPGGMFNEGPRRVPHTTNGGRLISTGYTNMAAPAAYVFDGREPLSKPRIVEIPLPPHKPRLCEPSWYQMDNGRILMFFRDETQSLRLYLSWSDDEGDTWSEAVITDIPDSMTKFHAGRLLDGRFYLVGTSIPRFLDRTRLTVLLSPTGESFNELYVLLDEPTRRRIEGGHKEDGYQYPNTIVEENRIIVIYSVNKEDVEAAIVDL